MNAWKSYLLNSIEYVFRIGRLFSAPAAVLRRARRLSQLRGKCIYPVPASLQLDGDIDIVGTGRFRIDEYSRLGNNVYLETHDSGEIEIGKRVRINAGTYITARSGVRIGDDTLVGEYTSIRDANHGTAAGRPIRSQSHDIAAIEIGRDVWIGRGCCILKGVRIGDGAVVGANSVVTADVPSGAVVAGSPARALSNRNERDPAG
jgi:acetyltransferase-like isoleucine patch superfamily enzyme